MHTSPRCRFGIMPKMTALIRPIGLCCFLLLLFSAKAWGIECSKVLPRLAYSYEKDLVSTGERSFALLKDLEQLAPGSTRQGGAVFEMELEILDLLQVYPTLRNYPDFAKKYGLTLDQAKNIVDWYALRFIDEPTVSLDRSSYLDRTTALRRVFRLTDEQNPQSRRYLYYLVNLGHKSVPQMARELQISEGQVYQDISRHRLSLKGTFLEDDRLEKARQLLASGTKLEAVAEELGVGTRALEFALHHSGDKNRGQSWDRELHLDGRPLLEPQVLITLFEKGLTHQAIADQLNSLAGTGADEPSYRTAASVQAKLGELGLSKEALQGPTDVALPGYGPVKEDGELVLSAVRLFLFDHAEAPLAWKATQLGVTPSGLEAFVARHDLARAAAPRDAQSSSDATPLNSKSLEKAYEKQRRVASFAFVEWVRAHGNSLPTNPGKAPKNETAEHAAQRLPQKNAYAWMQRNRQKAPALKDLPEDIRNLVVDWKPKEKTMDAEAFASWVRTHGNALPTAPSKPPKNETAEQAAQRLKQKNAYQWLQRNHEKAAILKDLPEDIRKLATAWKPIETMNAETFASWVRVHNNLLPTIPGNAPKNETAEQAAQGLKQKYAYSWLRRNHEKAAILKDLPEDIRKLAAEWKPRERAMNAEGFASWVRTNGDTLPPPPEKPTENETTDQAADRLKLQNAYGWMRRNRDKAAALKDLPEDIRKLVADWKPKQKTMDTEAFVSWVRAHGNTLPTHRRKPPANETAEQKAQRLTQKSAYQWMLRNRDNAAVLKELPDEIREMIQTKFGKQ